MRSADWGSIAFWGVVAASAALGISYHYGWGPETLKPSKEMMRQHLVKAMNDEQLQTLIANAKNRIERIKNQNEKYKESYWKKESERNLNCSNEVYKIRNEASCKPPMLGFLGPAEDPVPTLEESIDESILGSCVYMKTVREAREHGCLPKR